MQIQPPDCPAEQGRLHADEPLTARHADVHTGEDQVEESPVLRGRPATIQEKGYAVYPVGWLPGGKGDDFNVEVFYSEDQDETL